MKKIKFSILFIATAMLSLQSCTDDLNVTPEDDDVFLSDKFFNSPQSYRQGLAGVYANLTLTGANGSGNSNLQGIDAGTSQYGRCLWYLQELTTDEVVWSYENDPGTRDLQRNVWTSENPILLGMFSRIMLEVAFANEYLRQTTPQKLSSRGVTDAALLADIELYRKEVRALRAYSYYMMMDLFGKAPMVTENDPINFFGPQFERAQLFEFVESELTELLPDLKAPRTNEYGRLDQAFAHMVLAKMYLNSQVYLGGSGRFADCLTHCSAVINAGYTLESNYLDNFNADNHTSSEMIFTLQSDGAVTQTYGATTVIINGEVGSVENNGGLLGVTPGWGGALRLRRQLVEKFNGGDFDFDIRKQQILGTDRTIDIVTIADPSQGFVTTKFRNISSTGTLGINGVFVDTDFPLFRLADAYMMYAEASLRGGGGDAGLALDYVNQLRTRANNGSTSGNISQSELTLDFILDERAREFYWEGHRRQDLIRFGKYTGGFYNWAWKGNASSGVSIPATRSIFPIPAQSIAANPNLTQNPGY